MRCHFTRILSCLFLWHVHLAVLQADKNPPIQISGIYPHLTMWNDENECGTGAVVPWQGRLWAITYAPHQPGGSTDKLYEITPDLKQIIFEGSVGGTPANRMIHRESQQLLIGPYLIDAQRHIRVLPPGKMFGRLTANARHLTNPARKIYYATMEEGLYEVDLNTLDVLCLIRDGNSGAPEVGMLSQLPGYHGKGMYSGQGQVIYANNGERHPDVSRDPTIPSGSLARWSGEGDWQMVRRNQFTEVTGPGGIYGNTRPDTDPIWTLGWDARSLILGLLEKGKWYFYRLPKGSHSYDGSHGWNTEWPRIREIGEEDLLATMHGTFWNFPSDFSRAGSAGISPRSNYLKVVGDFCRWGDRVVLGCDDSARAEFMNTRSFKSPHGAPKQSNSNLWFVEPSKLDELGPVVGRGSVWLREDVKEGQVSDPYLFAGYDHRMIHIHHASEHEISVEIEIDREGNDQWSNLHEWKLAPGGAHAFIFPTKEKGIWLRVRCSTGAKQLTAHFQYRNIDQRGVKNAPLFDGIATSKGKPDSFGLMRSLSYDRLGVVAASDASGNDAGFYTLTPEMELQPVDDSRRMKQLISNVTQPAKAYTVDAASVVIVEDGKRYRLPKSDDYQEINQGVGRSSNDPTLESLLPTHLAKGASVKVSSTHGDYTGNNVVDGVLTDDSRWIAKQGEGKHWIELDLGQQETFRNIWVITGWQNGTTSVAQDFDIQIKVGDVWETVERGNVRGNLESRFELELEEPISTRSLRIRASTPEYFRVYEIALFAERPNISDFDVSGFSTSRVCREVATERDLLNIHGTFYELPARNAQGLAKMRPIATHQLRIHDFCSHNGLLFMTGINDNIESDHIFRSEDGKAAVWAGVVDDLWNLGKPRGVGGPWFETEVKPGQPSDPYIMTGYDHKLLKIRADRDVNVTLEVDVDGTGLWIPYQTFEIQGGKNLHHRYPAGYSAYWVRAICDKEAVVTVQFKYQ